MKLKCDKCGKEIDFTDEKEAFKAGWDFPPMCSVTTCGTCPSAPLMFPTEDKNESGQRNTNT